MVRHGLPVALVLAVCGGCGWTNVAGAARGASIAGRAGRGPGAIDVPLKFVVARPDEDVFFLAGGRMLTGDEPHKGYKPPPGLLRPQFYGVMGWVGNPVVLALGGSSKSSGPDTVWLDWNADRKFTRDELVQGKRVTHGAGTGNTWVVFGPFTHKVRDGSALPPFQLMVDPSDETVFAVSPGYRLGEVDIGGRKVRIAALDTNLNGVFGDGPPENPSGNGWYCDDGDVLLVDFTGDGKFSGTFQDWEYHAQTQECLPWPNMVQMPDAKYYEVSVARDGSRLTLTPVAGLMGTLHVTAPRVSLDLSDEKHFFQIRSAKPDIQIPEGTYLVNELECYGPTKQHGWWWMSVNYGLAQGNPRPTTFGHLAITAGKTTVLECGPPIRAEALANVGPGGYFFDTMLYDRGNHWLGTVGGPDTKSSPLVISLYDEKGKLLRKGEQKWEVRRMEPWKLPASWIGRKLRAVEQQRIDPFGVVRGEVWFTVKKPPPESERNRYPD